MINCLVVRPEQAALYMSFGGDDPVITALMREVGDNLARSRPGGTCALCSDVLPDVALDAAAISITYSIKDGYTDQTHLIGFICEPCCKPDDTLINRCRAAALSQFPIQFFHMEGSTQ